MLPPIYDTTLTARIGIAFEPLRHIDTDAVYGLARKLVLDKGRCLKRPGSGSAYEIQFLRVGSVKPGFQFLEEVRVNTHIWLLPPLDEKSRTVYASQIRYTDGVPFKLRPAIDECRIFI